MVISFDVPLRASDEAVVKFLLGIVFGSQKKRNSSSRECLRHDVNGACKIITWILQNHQKRSFTVACNLIYGNTLVLSQQVARLLLDAVRAREVVAFTSYLAEEEERRKKTFEQMQSGFEDDFTTPKKKRRSKAVAEDDYLLASPTPISIALKQNITMPDVFAMQREDDICVEDDLVPPTMEQFEMLYGMLDSENRNTTLDLTFLDRCASSSNARNPLDIAFDASSQPNPIDSELQRPTDDFEFQRPTDEFISSQQRTPNKNDRTQEEIFDPAPELADILLYGRLPLLNEGGQRRSMEDEMEDARHHGISAEMDVPLQPMEVPRMISEPILLDPLDIDTFPRAPRPPRSAQKNQTAISSESDAAQDEGIRHKIPLASKK
ncbi:hypothetical protein GCK72_006256 [Caenorhabditis remanei]|uniref:Uncharacterized protein n=1 Tax=Caenorhabditis remanei TaxID=31234 RepID=A0A6A5HEQ5_CAERE|nr:hypothetical protein GCK72_006256 [Caenorhabditis remanei]KAF1766300.1 hypothetical protein GCK72_006256 [Caenorhabditis remanei]